MSRGQIVICYAGPAIALGKLNRLELLAAVYTEVQLPEPVYREVVIQGAVQGEPDARLVRILGPWPTSRHRNEEPHAKAQRRKEPKDAAARDIGWRRSAAIL